jgi:hypothetical protein
MTDRKGQGRPYTICGKGAKRQRNAGKDYAGKDYTGSDRFGKQPAAAYGKEYRGPGPPEDLSSVREQGR